MKNEYYVKIQSRKTLRYNEKQHYQNYMTLPAELCRLRDIESGQFMRLAITEKGDLICAKVTKVPIKHRQTYEEWLKQIKPHIPATPPGKAYAEICKDAGVMQKSAPAIWVNKAKADIGLDQIREVKTHRTLWIRTKEEPTLSPDRSRTKDTKINNPKFLTATANA